VLPPLPTPCGLAFADVPPTDPFHASIRCLACRGIFSGYPCGGAGEPCDPGQTPYFRAGSPVTRAQFAKIVLNAVGNAAPIPAGQQTFADVPGTHPLWLFVERAQGRALISGYSCGAAPAGPCDSGQRPYYLPDASLTRAQLAKLIMLGVGYPAPIPSTRQTFADVPPSHPFWLAIERCALPGVISGYQCGGPGEPCDGQNRPYFRPAALNTRAQAAKIVAQAVFPNCIIPARPPR
jgi:hypothetical protein